MPSILITFFITLVSWVFFRADNLVMAWDYLGKMFAFEWEGIRPDAVTDQTSAHDPANGYCPAGWSVAKWMEMREKDPKLVAAAVTEKTKAVICVHYGGHPCEMDELEAICREHDLPIEVFDLAIAGALAKIAAGERGLPSLRGWRRKVFGADAERLCDGELALRAKGQSVEVVAL